MQPFRVIFDGDTAKPQQVVPFIAKIHAKKYETSTTTTDGIKRQPQRAETIMQTGRQRHVLISPTTAKKIQLLATTVERLRTRQPGYCWANATAAAATTKQASNKVEARIRGIGANGDEG
jgi:hypothetical protein